MQDSVFSPPIALPPFSKRSPIKSGDFSNATVELVKLVRRKLVSVPLWHKLLFLKGVNLDLGILVMRLPTTQIACLGQLNVSVPLRGFWYSGLSDKAVEEVAWFVKFQSPYGDFSTLTMTISATYAPLPEFQSPYGDLVLLLINPESRGISRQSCFGPPKAQTPFPKRSLVKSGDFGTPTRI